MFTARRMARSRWTSPPGVTVCSHMPVAPRASAPPRSCSLKMTCAWPPRTMASSVGGPSTRPSGAAEQVEGAEDDVVGAERDGRRVGEDAGELAAGAPRERARLAAVAGGRVVDEQHAAEREEAAEPGDLRARQRRDLAVAAPVEERRVDDGRIVGAHDARPQARGRARPLHELPRPPPRRRRPRGARLVARQEHARVERPQVAERLRRPRRQQHERDGRAGRPARRARRGRRMSGAH